MSGKKALRDGALGDGVCNWSLGRLRLDSVDRRPSETEEAVTRARGELRRELLSELDFLASDGNTSDLDSIGVDIARC